MKKNTEMRENPFLAACQRMNDMVNVCRNWLTLVEGSTTALLRAESGCLRSVRLARTLPVTHEPTTQSALMIVVLPAVFDGIGQRAYDHRQWQLFVYSWLGREQTRSLYDHLSAKTSLQGCSFFLVKEGTNEKI